MSSCALMEKLMLKGSIIPSLCQCTRTQYSDGYVIHKMGVGGIHTFTNFCVDSFYHGAVGAVAVAVSAHVLHRLRVQLPVTSHRLQQSEGYRSLAVRLQPFPPATDRDIRLCCLLFYR